MKSINSLALILSTIFLGRAARPGPACTSVCYEGCLPWSVLCAVFLRFSLPANESKPSAASSSAECHSQGSDKPSASVTLVTAAFCLTCLALACLLAVALACSYYSYPCPRISGPDQCPNPCLICLNMSCIYFLLCLATLLAYWAIAMPLAYWALAMPLAYWALIMPLAYWALTMPLAYWALTMPLAYWALAMPLAYWALAMPLAYWALAMPLAYWALAMPLAYWALAMLTGPLPCLLGPCYASCLLGPLAYWALAMPLAYWALAMPLAYWALAMPLAYWALAMPLAYWCLLLVCPLPHLLIFSLAVRVLLPYLGAPAMELFSVFRHLANSIWPLAVLFLISRLPDSALHC